MLARPLCIRQTLFRLPFGEWRLMKDVLLEAAGLGLPFQMARGVGLFGLVRLMER
jgi:hypothetical protein